MFAMITTDEYKELLNDQQTKQDYYEAFVECADELNEVRGQFNNLLLFITKGAKASQWQDGKFECFDLARDYEIANYINENFMRDSRLNIKENNNA
jgi:hypothetical protein